MARILAIEDEDSIVDLYREVLIEEGHEVRTALGIDALARAEAGEADLILLDLMLPLLPGGTIARYLQECPATRRIPIIVVSALDGVEDSLRALGVRYHLRKPFDIADLVALVARALYEDRKEHADGN